MKDLGFKWKNHGLIAASQAIQEAVACASVENNNNGTDNSRRELVNTLAAAKTILKVLEANFDAVNSLKQDAELSYELGHSTFEDYDPWQAAEFEAMIIYKDLRDFLNQFKGE